MFKTSLRRTMTIVIISMTFAFSLFSENVPTSYVTYSLEELKIGDRAGTSGEGLIGSGGTVIIGSDAKVFTSITATGNVTLYDRDTVFGDVTTGGTLIRSQSGQAIVTGTIEQYQQVPVYSIPQRTVTTGSENRTINNDQSGSIPPGNYNTIEILDRATLELSEGLYNVREFIIGNDSRLIFDISTAGGIEINASETFRIGDRVRMSFEDNENKSAVSFYTHGTTEMVVGYECIAFGTFIAPNAKIIIHDRSTFSGAVYGKRVELQPSIFFITDDVFPSISLLSPVPGSILNTVHPQLSIQFSDNKSGIDTSTFQATINGVDYTAEFQLTYTGAIWQVPENVSLPQGSNTVVSFIKDRAGNAVENTATFTIDINDPVVSIISPVNGSVSNNTKPSIDITYSDEISGVNTALLNVQLDGTDITSNFDITETRAYFQLTDASALSEGSHSIIASISDNAGNVKEETITFSIDVTPPSVAITSPADGLITNVAEQNISWTVDGIEQGDQTSVTLVEGANSVTRSATDVAGNIGSASITITLDTVPPTVAINSPEENFLTNQTPVEVQWSVDGILQSDLTSEDLLEGENTIERSSTDAAGNVGTALITGTLDTEPPEVVITAPVDNYLTNQTSVQLEWTIDGVSQPVETVELSTEGVNTVTRSATDAAGNMASATVNILRDTEAPIVAIVSPENGFLTNTADQIITWTVDGV
ncbi:MAG: Ig-like domain-containing protein, partial [Candidatus Pacearchaeota archaeon]|nr:Ig-like domain-containing protein [Candidatus Pacearchaeota archaeon]